MTRNKFSEVCKGSASPLGDTRYERAFVAVRPLKGTKAHRCLSVWRNLVFSR